MKKIVVGILALPIILNAEKKIGLFDDKQAIESTITHLPSDPVILDAGAYTGSEISYMKKVWPNSTIHAFEPVPELFQKLKKNTRRLSNVHHYQLGLDATSGLKKFYLSNQPGQTEVSMSSSLREPKDHLKHDIETQFKKEMTIQCLNLDEWAKAYNIEKIDMLWLDMQGVELEVMQAAPNIMKTVKVVYTEVEFVEAYKGQAQWRELRKWLEEQGFYLIARDFDLPPKFWFGNAIFARK